MRDRLHALRTRAGLSGRELDRLAAITPNHSGFIERGQIKRAGIGTVERLARVLGCSIGWLASGEGEPPTDDQIAAAVAAARARLTTTTAPEVA